MECERFARYMYAAQARRLEFAAGLRLVRGSGNVAGVLLWHSVQEWRRAGVQFG